LEALFRLKLTLAKICLESYFQVSYKQGASVSNLFKDKKLNFKEFPPVSTEEWENVIIKDLKGADYKEKLRWDTKEGISALPFYRREHLPAETFIEVPGGWEICQSVGADKPGKVKAHVQDAVNGGAQSLLLEFPTDFITSVKDFSQIMDDIVSNLTSLHVGKLLSTPKVIKIISEWYTKQNFSRDELILSFDFDPFALGVFSGKLPEKEEIQNVRHSNMRCLSVACNRYGDAGATTVQQLAFALSAGNEYLGMTDADNSTLHFNFSAGSYYFLEIAKFRAFRLLWNRILEEYQIDQNRPYVHAKTTLLNKSKMDVHTNLLRTTTEAMAAAVGGCDAITVHRFDEGFAEPAPFAQRIARNVQHILTEEAHFDKVSDPGSGSYYIENLTRKLIDESWKLFREIEAKGGFYECIKQGVIQKQLRKAQTGKLEAVEQQKTTLVGVNKYQAEDQKYGANYNYTGSEEPDIKLKTADVEAVAPVRLAEPFEEESKS